VAVQSGCVIDVGRGATHGVEYGGIVGESRVLPSFRLQTASSDEVRKLIAYELRLHFDTVTRSRRRFLDGCAFPLTNNGPLPALARARFLKQAEHIIIGKSARKSRLLVGSDGQATPRASDGDASAASRHPLLIRGL
jgi:hypothetical protein